MADVFVAESKIHGLGVLAAHRFRAGEEISYDYLLDCHGGDPWQSTCWSP
jgi:hypothetical protein